MRFPMLFPGQGSQVVGMGADLVAAYPAARQVFAQADAWLGYSLSALCFDGPLETLTETQHAQPALLVHSVATLAVLRQHGIEPSVAAGHSLGEYTALVAAGSLEFEAAVRIVRRRGELMFESGLHAPGAMAAVIGLEANVITRVCKQVYDLGVCELANLNAPGQIVISGSVAAVDAALPLLKTAGAKLAKRLNVSGAFHSSLMQAPARELAAYLDTFACGDARVPVVCNVTATATQDAGLLRERLKQQITAPVRWSESMQTLHGIDASPVLEVGAGSVLKGLHRRIQPESRCTSVGERAALEAFLAEIATAPGSA